MAGLIARRRLKLSGGTELSFLEAGDTSGPTVLLLHGFPNAARMFEPLMTELAPVAHFIAPDLPGFGESEPLPVASFSAFCQAVAELLERLEVGPRFIYVHDFGAPVALHLAMDAPELVLGLIIQNANAHRSGHDDGWAATQAFWADPNPQTEAAATAHLTLEGTRDQYVSGVPPEIASRMDPAQWQEDWRVMNLPGRMETQRALVRDYGRYVAQFDAVAGYLARQQPPALLLWGRHDAFFALPEVVSWLEDLPRMEAHVFDAGHLLLETHSAQAAPLIAAFIRRTLAVAQSR